MHLTLKKTAVAAALLASSLAFAQVRSTPQGGSFDRAELDVNAVGNFVTQAEFQIPANYLELDFGTLKPGSSFSITIPVTNTANRTLTVTGGITFANPNQSNTQRLLSVTRPGDATIAPGATTNMVYSFQVAGADAFRGLTWTDNSRGVIRMQLRATAAELQPRNSYTPGQ